MKPTRGTRQTSHEINEMQKKGFTLVELLIASSIALITLAVVALIYVSTNRSFKFGQITLNSDADLRVAMDWLTKDIRQAKNLVLSGDTVTIEVPPSVSNDIIYTFSSNKLQRTISGSTPRTIAVDISEVGVSIVTDDTVAITLSSTKTVFNNPHTRTLTSEVTMRNK